MPDQSAPAVHGAVAAALAEDGWDDHGPHEGHHLCERRYATTVKQTAAVLRWAIENADEGVHVTVSNWMRAQADEIDPPMGAAR